jgi:hypothetical protein
MSAEPLVHLVEILQPSLVMFLADCGLGTYPGPEEVRLALADLVADQRNIIDRAVAILEEREVPVPKSAYPLSFTGLHDVDVRYVLPRVVADLRRQSAQLERIAEVRDDATAAGLASEARRSMTQQIDVLEQITTKLRAGLSAKPLSTGSDAEPSAAPAAS